MIVGQRILGRLPMVKLTQTELARRVGMSQGAMNNLIAGRSRSSTFLHKIAHHLRTTPAYLEGDTNDPLEGALPDPTPELIASQLDLVAVASIDLAYGMGGTFTDVPIEEELLYFPRSWIESITSTPPEMLTIARGRGDSMSPTIQDNDMVLIDRSQKRPREQDVIWALTVGDVGMIKRLRMRAQGVTILSDNERVPPDEATGDEVHIVGRVIHIGRNV